MEITKENNFISCVIYLSNKSDKEVMEFFNVLIEFLELKFKKYEFVLVNDDYRNMQQTKDYLESKRMGGLVTIVNLSHFYGVETAMSAGVDIAIGDYVFEFDKIGSITLELLEQVYCKCMEGNDIVRVTSRVDTDLLSKLFYCLYNHSISYQHEKLKSEIFRLVSRRAINRIKSMALSVPYRKVQYAQCGLPIATIEEKQKKCRKNRRTDELHAKSKLAIDTLILFTDLMAKVTIILCAFFLFFSLAVGVYVCICYFGINKPVEGWAPIMGFLSAGFFGLFAILTIIIKYLTVIVRMIFVKQDYLIESVGKL